jgi:hypothetical protein
VIGYLRRVREDRWRRAARRRRTEEIMGWICVPLLLGVGWMAWQAWEQANPGRPLGFDPATATATSVRRN